MIPLSQPLIKGREWKYVKECLDTGWVSSVGAYVDRFEKSVAAYAKTAHGVACVNGTSALHTALMVAGVTTGDEVIVPALTFAAPAFAVSYCGAYPVFMDVDADFWQMDPAKLKDFLTTTCVFRNKKLINKITKRTIKAIIPVHLLGHPCDMDAIMDLARRFHLTVIEDAAESIGALYKGRKVGGIADMGCFSFNGNKIITAGGGGVLVSNDARLVKQVRYLTTQAKDDAIEYVHNAIGYNYRLTNVQAAIGCAQMEQLDGFIAAKGVLAARYTRALADVPGLRLPLQAPWAKSTFWLYTILVDPKKYGMDRSALMALLKEKNIQSRPVWHPLHQLKPFRSAYAFHVIEANKVYRRALSLPSSPDLSIADQTRVIKSIYR